MKLKEICIRNFKSLRECRVNLRNFNILVGPNASGKSNFVELFELLKRIYVQRDPFPFLKWWGYGNVVWDRNEELPIEVKLLFDIKGYEVSFETIFTGTGGKFQILKEAIEIKNYLTIEREGEWITIRHDEDFFNDAWAKLQSEIKQKKEVIFPKFKDVVSRKKEDLIVQKGRVKGEHVPFGLFGYGGTATYFDELALSYIHLDFPEKGLISLEPTEKEIKHSKEAKIEFLKSPLSWIVKNKIRQFMSKITVLKDLDFKSIREPQKLIKDLRLSEDGGNVSVVLHNLFLKEKKLPDSVELLTSGIFPNIELEFEMTQDGRIFIKGYERYLDRIIELLPPSLPDGLYKILVIGTAIDLEPSILIIDEIENSLHPKALELVIDTLKDSGITTILTTHSPAVVDIVDPEDLILVDKNDQGTIFSRVENPEEIRRILEEKGITLSERWLYGKL